MVKILFTARTSKWKDIEDPSRAVMHALSFVSKSNFLLAKDACIKVAYYIIIIIDSDILSIFM